jgi:hypothetical protein
MALAPLAGQISGTGGLGCLSRVYIAGWQVYAPCNRSGNSTVILLLYPLHSGCREHIVTDKGGEASTRARREESVATMVGGDQLAQRGDPRFLSVRPTPPALEAVQNLNPYRPHDLKCVLKAASFADLHEQTRRYSPEADFLMMSSVSLNYGPRLFRGSQPSARRLDGLLLPLPEILHPGVQGFDIRQNVSWLRHGAIAST